MTEPDVTVIRWRAMELAGIATASMARGDWVEAEQALYWGLEYVRQLQEQTQSA